MDGGGREGGRGMGGGLRSAPDFVVDALISVGAVDEVLEVLGEPFAGGRGVGVDFHNVIVGFVWPCAGHDKVVDSLELAIRRGMKLSENRNRRYI